MSQTYSLSPHDPDSTHDTVVSCKLKPETMIISYRDMPSPFPQLATLYALTYMTLCILLYTKLSSMYDWLLNLYADNNYNQ